MMKIGNRMFDVEQDCSIMGILNVTPDSFSDGGKWNDIEKAKKHTADMIAEGAAIIDIGGESTRPGHVQISIQEEIDRVVPVIEMVKKEFDIPVSIDSYKGEVVEAALKAGADLVNDIWGLKYDPKMADVIAKADAACCLMHNRDNSDYGDFLSEWYQETAECVELAKKAGIADDRIILDPGVGFGKTYEQNLTTIKYMDDLKKLGYPLLLGTSRKSVIGLTIDTPVTDRAVGTAVTTVFAVQQGYAFVRVHDIKANKQAIQMTKAILNA